MILDIFLLVVAFYLAIPLVAGYTAKSYGRSFWNWFFITCAIPAISYLILYFLIRRDIKRNKIKSLLTNEEIKYMENEVQDLLKTSVNPPIKKASKR